MAITIEENALSVLVQGRLNRATDLVAESVTKLASGLRVRTAADDPAGFGIAQQLQAQTRSLVQASRNTGDGVSLLQTGEGSLGEIGNILTRMRELAVQSSNGTLTNTDRSALNTEYQSLKAEIDRINDVTLFNTRRIIDGTLSGGITFQVGIDSTSASRITVSVASARTSRIGGTATVASLSPTTIATTTGANIALNSIDDAILDVNATRTRVGAGLNRLSFAQSEVATRAENLTSARARIVDVDVAAETARFVRAQVVQQASIALLAQANLQPQLALALLPR